RELAEVKFKGQKREEALEQKYRDLVDSIEHGLIWTADTKDFVFTFVSPSAEKITGFGFEEWRQEKRFWFDRIPREDHKALKEAFEKARSGQQSVLEHRFIAKDGRTLWFHTGIRLTQINEGRDTELHGLSVDMTSIRESEKQLLSTQRHL